jgi:DNA modification methylase
MYVAKAPRSERDAGLPPGLVNDHPTVKPIDVMRWLARLVTPPGGLVLDPFMGSGTTGCACELEGFRFLGVRSESARHMEIASHRMAYWRRMAAKAR